MKTQRKKLKKCSKKNRASYENDDEENESYVTKWCVISLDI